MMYVAQSFLRYRDAVPASFSGHLQEQAGSECILLEVSGR